MSSWRGWNWDDGNFGGSGLEPQIDACVVAAIGLCTAHLHAGLQAANLLTQLLSEGMRTTFHLPAGEAFGERNPEMQQWVARKLLNDFGDPDEQYQEGDVVQFPTPDGQGSYAGAVLQVREDGAVLFDFNHPLAGQPVSFEVYIIGAL